MPKKSKLQVSVDPDLLGRVNAAAELTGVKREQWVITILEDEVEKLEADQQQLKREWQARLRKRQKKKNEAAPAAEP